MRLVPPVLLASLVLVATVALAGCGGPAVPDSSSQEISGGIEDIVISGARFSGTQAPDSDELYPADSDVTLTVTITNEGTATERLKVTSSVGDTEFVGDTRLAGGATVVSGNPQVRPEPAARPVSIRFTDLWEPLRAGQTYPVKFATEHSGAITLEVPAVQRPGTGTS